MAIQYTTQTVRHAATLLTDIEWINQEEALQLSSVAEAVNNMFMVLYYQAGSGQATQADFQEAKIILSEALQMM